MRQYLLKLWAYFPFLFFIVIAHALRRSHGHLRFNHLVFLTIGTILFTIWSYRDSSEWKSKIVEKIFYFIWLLFSIFLVIKSEIIYGLDNNWAKMMSIALWLNLTLSFSSIINKKSNLKYPLTVGGLVSLGIALFVVIPTSPSPHIDVWEYARLGADYFLSGKNPYLFHYPDLYKGRYELTNGFCYWPTATHFYTISRYFFGDVRWALVGAHVFSFLGLLKLSNLTTLKEKFLAPLIWFSFPVTFFVLEQAWVDGFIIPFIIWYAWFAFRGQFLRAAIMLGFMCMAKQYMIFFAVLSFFYILKVGGFKKAFIYTLLTTTVSLVLAGPFLLWDANLFFKKTITDLLTLGFRDDALSWVAYFSKFYGIYIKGLWTGILYVITLGFLSVRIYRAKERHLESLFSSLVIMYFVVFLFGKQAFCNYYYMLASIILTYILLRIIPDHSKKVSIS